MNNEIPEEIRKMFPDQPIHKMDIDDNGNLQIFASTEPLSNEPDFDNLPKEQIYQYLREHGYDPEQVRITGKIFITALIENVTLQARIAALEALLADLITLLDDEQSESDVSMTEDVLINIKTQETIGDLETVVEHLQNTLSEWQGVARQLADELTEANAERFSISREDASEASPAWIAYCNLRDRED